MLLLSCLIVQKPKGADKGTMNCDSHTDDLEDEFQASFEAQKYELKKHAKQQIFKMKDENRKTYNLRRREPKSYIVGDLVAIKLSLDSTRN
ncbi:hypothetical protein NPIL_567221 [Nephila pilipes]|uniref:Uncharacterized protein n=1 Tax=Nephila pilipes TaxID=299642 RepID=A0A8X6NZJ2_NEPPI|nr:hypothetical protein NPIL_567221 [Nephila pilipes]